MPSDFRWHSFLVSADYLPDTFCPCMNLLYWNMKMQNVWTMVYARLCMASLLWERKSLPMQSDISCRQNKSFPLSWESTTTIRKPFIAISTAYMQGGISRNWLKNTKKNFCKKIRIAPLIGAYNNHTTRENPIDILVVVEYIIGNGCAVDARGVHSRRSSCVGSFFTICLFDF